MPQGISSDNLITVVEGGPVGGGVFSVPGLNPFNMGYGPTGTQKMVVDLSPFTQRSQPPANFTGQTWGGIYFWNDTDTSYYLSFIGGSAQNFILAPGDKTSVLVPVGATEFQLLAIYQNQQQAHPLQLLTAVYFTQQDLDNGWASVEPGGGVVNPSVPAGSILPGSLPEGVTIGADDVGATTPNETLGAHAFLNPAQVNAGTFPSGVLLPAGQVSAGTLIAGVHETSITSDGGNITSDGTGVLTLGRQVDKPASGQDAVQMYSSDGVQGLSFGYFSATNHGVNPIGWYCFDVPGGAFLFQGGTTSAIQYIGSVTAKEFLSNQAGGGAGTVTALDIVTTGSPATHYALIVAGDGTLRIFDVTNNEPFLVFSHGANTGSSENFTLRAGTQETGVCGVGLQTLASGGETGNIMLNFRQRMTNTPSSITLAAISTSNVTSGPTVDTITKDGFTAHVVFGTGGGSWFGSYTTVGN